MWNNNKINNIYDRFEFIVLYLLHYYHESVRSRWCLQMLFHFIICVCVSYEA